MKMAMQWSMAGFGHDVEDVDDDCDELASGEKENVFDCQASEEEGTKDHDDVSAYRVHRRGGGKKRTAVERTKGNEEFEVVRGSEWVFSGIWK